MFSLPGNLPGSVNLFVSKHSIAYPMLRFLLLKPGEVVFLLLVLSGCMRNESSDRLISAQQVNEILNDSNSVGHYVVVDTRRRMDYIRGHLVSAIWINADSMPSHLRTLPKIGKKIVVYDSAGENYERIVKLFRDEGFTNVYHLEGGFANWATNHFPAAIQLVKNTSTTLDVFPISTTADELYDLIDNGESHYAIIDVRPLTAFIDGHIRKAISIPYVPLNEFVVNIEEQNFPRSKPLVVYCDASTCSTAEKAAEVLLRNDYTEVYILKNGIDEWAMKDYPMEYGKPYASN
jgi:rhodanese-related sulfurtransferase